MQIKILILNWSSWQYFIQVLTLRYIISQDEALQYRA